MSRPPNPGSNHSIYAANDQWSAWCAQADLEGLSISMWIRRACNHRLQQIAEGAAWQPRPEPPKHLARVRPVLRPPVASGPLYRALDPVTARPLPESEIKPYSEEE